MLITVTTFKDSLFTLDVSGDMELFNFIALCEAESGISSNLIQLSHDGKTLTNSNKTLSSYGIKDGDMIALQKSQAISTAGLIPKIDFSSINIPGNSSDMQSMMKQNSQALLNKLRNSPADLAILKERNLPLAEAIQSNDINKFTKILVQQQSDDHNRQEEHNKIIKGNQFDIGIQNKIAEEIRLKNVEHNMENAIEFSPESFGMVVMLFIDCKVNGHDVKAFVDSGAQMTIMSSQCAERCGLGRLIDTRWEGMAKGVGTQKIIGRVHLCQVQIGKDFLQCSLSILENQSTDMLLGLDMLKRHQCIIDMKRNCLHIGTTSSDTKFLSESEIPVNALSTRVSNSENDIYVPEHKRMNYGEDDEDYEPMQGTSSGQGQEVNEQHVVQLMSNGFTRKECEDELKRQKGDVNTALVVLLSKSFGAK